MGVQKVETAKKTFGYTINLAKCTEK